jgi:hypothetical protein
MIFVKEVSTSLIIIPLIDTPNNCRGTPRNGCTAGHAVSRKIVAGSHFIAKKLLQK